MGPRRQALAQRGGDLELRGEPTAAGWLAEAWLAAREAPVDTLTHGFHAYPARLHPGLAAYVLDTWPAATRASAASPVAILDPFCGSGTVLVECTARGLPAVGVDLNPLAVRLSRLKCQTRGAEARARLLAAAEAVTAASLEHVRARDDLRAPLPRREVAWYEPHVLKELAGLWLEIGRVASPEDREALRLVFSSLVVKFSRQRADTAEQVVAKRLRKGLASEFFERKASELVQRWRALEERCAALGRAPGAPDVIEGDAREVSRLVGPRRFDLVLSSPPYGGTYDYVGHHARRLAWLGLDPSAFEQREVGARRRVSGHEDGLARWDHELHEILLALGRVIAPGGHAALVLGDASEGGRVRSASAQLEALAPAAGWRFVASASEARVDWFGAGPRREHLVWLQAVRGSAA